MEDIKISIMQTIFVIVALMTIQVFTRKAINRTLKKMRLNIRHRKITIQVLNFFSFLIAFILLLSIWGVDHSQLLLFISASTTILGVAFFAHWSVLSNITSSLILFFSHPVHIGEKIKILDDNYPIEGIIVNMTFFFVHLETMDGEKIIISNNTFLQKIISFKNEPK